MMKLKNKVTNAAMQNRELAVLLTWTDIPCEDEAAFNEWYNREHVRDRVLEVPGFINGRRFIAIKGSPKYLAFYKAENASVLKSDAYINLITHPDERSRYFIMRFRNPIRTLARLSASLGEGEGGVLSILAFAPERVDAATLRTAIITKIMPVLYRMHGSIAVHLLEQLPPQDSLSTMQHVRQGDRALSWALMIEASEEKTLADAAAYLEAGQLTAVGARSEIPMATFRSIYRVSPQ